MSIKINRGRSYNIQRTTTSANSELKVVKAYSVFIQVFRMTQKFSFNAFIFLILFLFSISHFSFYDHAVVTYAIASQHCSTSIAIGRLLHLVHLDHRQRCNIDSRPCRRSGQRNVHSQSWSITGSHR